MIPRQAKENVKGQGKDQDRGELPKLSLQIPNQVVPRRLWLYLLSFLDKKSLLSSMLVCKTWYDIGADESLCHISNRVNMEDIRVLDLGIMSHAFLQTIYFFPKKTQFRQT